MSYRKVDIDALDEEKYVEENVQTKSNEEIASSVNSKVHEVRQILSRGQHAQALSRALDDPPYGQDVQELKDTTTQVVMEVLSSTKLSDIPNVVKSLAPEELDVLMKYLYRGMASPEQYNCSVILSWHEKVIATTGLGSIIRVLTDRNTV
ncbi:ARP2/3 complex 16 kDa subunit (p16-Arc) [Basidiobolus meristosporus CBS 931.73]|uniref:Actin-related protein 2/3 complex subunit 5 n=1 Tax=Basidiobolus meristosporus CBS 931.73 TaxID=1314790 RepID=A0A1Y1YJ50_9FUNG|nr:ARP2/3 complex 16 kDa subunit (p16-Arc) [Basidiobolus meristosporus CBS 931.73]|eukprot:ORX97978.1 ARP2/3 complex 16 kDa subunit (p16-Arc) [Basidiobolus meristosporus CBS 931.73]